MLFVNARRSRPRIAVVGLGCWYPGARGPRQLWENILARRREFRRMPDCRLSPDDYHDSDPSTPDRTYGRRAAVLDGFDFDWSKWRIPQATFESTDIVQWLALEVARQALEDLGQPRDALPRERIGVLVGNTLTGEHTRSQAMRLRWPYVRRVLQAAAEVRGLSDQALNDLIETMEPIYKSVFAPVTEDTLAGGLSNTIAGRICNHFDFHGGGYTVDGACSSSLLAICTAAEKLFGGDLDLALAGGVDISLDTFELIGFAKTGALSPDEMRVYDQRGNGFFPGEGCGFVVLERLDDARARGHQVYAVIDGWGISSDGKGGLTAPRREGQALALKRACERAGRGPESLDFIEGHGTGTKVGDRVELEAIATLFRDAGVEKSRACGVTSFKSIVGHTKAAAGVGALIKAVMAVNRRVLPPTAGCTHPNPVFEETARCLYPLVQGEVRDPKATLRAGVSAMGFGGINAHVTLESGDAPSTKLTPGGDERALLASSQETELFVLGAASVDELRARLPSLAESVEKLSLGDLTDLAAHLSAELPPSPAVRAAIIAGLPEELAAHLRALHDSLIEKKLPEGESIEGPRHEWWVAHRIEPIHLGFLMPGQGSQQLNMARVLVERYPWARDLVARADGWLAEMGAGLVSPLIFRATERAADPTQVEEWTRDLSRTEAAQPAICLASLLYSRHLANLGLKPAVVMGHSLGELTAFHVAGAFDEEALIKLAAVRGRAMAAPMGRPGAMAGLACGRPEAEALLRDLPGYAVVANLNSPRQTVVSGAEESVHEIIRRAEQQGIPARLLPVSNAFHSDLVLEAASHLKASAPLPATPGPLTCELISCMTTQPVEAGQALREHFARQVLAKVDFIAAAQRVRKRCDLLIEVGPGRVLSSLVADIVGTEGTPCLPVASRPEADRDLNRVLARAFVGGIAINWTVLYEGRLVRPFVPAEERRFIDNPCERLKTGTRTRSVPARENIAPPTPAPVAPPQDIEALLLDLAMKRTGFARESIAAESRLLDDLNLDSIKAAELVAAAAKQLGVAGRLEPSRLANATLVEVAATLREAMPTPAIQATDDEPSWVREFVIEYVAIPE